LQNCNKPRVGCRKLHRREFVLWNPPEAIMAFDHALRVRGAAQPEVQIDRGVFVVVPAIEQQLDGRHIEAGLFATLADCGLCRRLIRSALSAGKFRKARQRTARAADADQIRPAVLDNRNTDAGDTSHLVPQLDSCVCATHAAHSMANSTLKKWDRHLAKKQLEVSDQLSAICLADTWPLKAES
jgi:hypothetical protein